MDEKKKERIQYEERERDREIEKRINISCITKQTKM